MSRLPDITQGLRQIFRAPPVLRFDEPTGEGELHRTMRQIVDHPWIRHLPFMGIVGATLALLGVWVATRSPGMAIGMALLLYAQISALSSRYVIQSIWATTSLAVRRAVSRGSLSPGNPADRALVEKASTALRTYGWALGYVIPGFYALVAVILLILTLSSRDYPLRGGGLFAFVFVGMALNILLAFLPNRIFVRYAKEIIARSNRGT